MVIFRDQFPRHVTDEIAHMPDNRREIAARSRRLIAAHGKSNVSAVSGKVTGHYYWLGQFYMRVQPDDELYINDMNHRLGNTIFSQREIDSTGAFHDFAYERRLLSILRQATVLEDLASIGDPPSSSAGGLADV